MSETQRDLFMEWFQRFGATLRDDEYEGIIDALTEHDRQVAERAWDEGFDRGFYSGQAMRPDADASESAVENPHRAAHCNNVAVRSSPTDDERRGVTAQDFPEARAVSSANFRRSVQGERHTFDTDACVTRECGCEQGEPTDAQVLAGLNAWFAKGREQNGIVLQLLDADDLADYSPQSQDRLRAALRAAAATQEGENR